MHLMFLHHMLQENGCLAFVLTFVALTCLGSASAQDKVRDVKLESKLLKTTETIRVWTPPGYAADGDRRYPVMYCCQNTGMPIQQLAKLMAAGDFPPFILLNYEGPSQGGESGNAAAWSDQRQPSGSFFRKEVVPWVDANYRTVAAREGRVLIGCSKAGGGVMHLGLKYPELFGAIVSLDGALNLYDGKPGKGLDYAKDGDAYLQLIEKHGDAVKETPILLIEGSMFWTQGREHLAAFRKAGLKDVDIIDARDLGHGVSLMFGRHLPEILTTFINCTSRAGVGSPRIDPPGGVFASPVKVTLAAPATGTKLYYTTDGSDPARRQQEYIEPVTLDKPCMLRVVGVSADGKQVTRQRLVRFDIRTLPQSTERGKQEGLSLEVVEGSGGKRVSDFLRAALDGKAEVIHKGTASSFTFSDELVKKLAFSGGCTVIFRGILTVPETGVYRFQVIGSSAGLYLEDREGGLMKLIENVGDLSLGASVPLGKGSHRILGMGKWPQGHDPFQVRWRNGELRATAVASDDLDRKQTRVRIYPMNTMSVILVMATLATAAEPTEVPLGHKDFYPSPERPVGFRGDGNGCFPGATPVTEWREGTVGTKKSGAVDLLVTTDKKSHNLIWKVAMPSWANTQPIVVGDRVFTTAEPNLLVCVDAHTGKVLWTASVNPWELIGMDKAQAEKVQAMYDIWREALPHFEKMRGNGTMSRLVPSAEFKPIAEAFVQTTLPRISQSLKELDPEGAYDEAAQMTAEAIKKYIKLLAEAEKKSEASPVGKHDALNGQMTRLLDTLGRRIDACGKPGGAGRNLAGKIPLGVPWGHLVGFCMSAPVSDGQYVYASFGQGQTVCYDLNGKRIWGVHHQPNPQKDDLSSIASPLLAGDVLVDMHGSVDLLRGLDKRTGKLLWEAPTKGAGTRDGGGYYVGSHKVMRLVNGPKPVDVIVTTLCNIIRASDGRVMGTLPFEFAPSGGPSIVCYGDVVMKGAVGDNYRTPYIAYRLKLVGDDKVEAKEVWRTPRSSTPGYQAVVLAPTALIMASNQHAVLNPLTGEFLSRGSSNQIAGYSNTLAGKVFLWVGDGSRNWGRRGDEVFGTFSTADVTDPTKIKVISDKNVLGGVNKPRVPAMEKYAPELYALPYYTGNAYGWPAHFLHTDSAIFPSGNRLFIRSLSHLYCIGDPAVPYDWNPASRAENITKSLTVK